MHIPCAYCIGLSCNRYEYTYVKICSVNEIEFNTNTYMSKITKNSKCIFPARMVNFHQNLHNALLQAWDESRSPRTLFLLEGCGQVQRKTMSTLGCPKSRPAMTDPMPSLAPFLATVLANFQPILADVRRFFADLSQTLSRLF